MKACFLPWNDSNCRKWGDGVLLGPATFRVEGERSLEFGPCLAEGEAEWAGGAAGAPKLPGKMDGGAGKGNLPFWRDYAKRKA